MKRATTVELAVICAALAGCADPGEVPAGGRVEIAVAALDLEGVGDVVWDLEVVNGANPTPQTVWQRRVSSSRYGDGAGSASYVAPCDADPSLGDNTVRVWVVGVYAAPVTDMGEFAGGSTAGDGAVTGTPVAFQSPTTSGPLTRGVACDENGDVAVRFDVSLMRPARQGFFDVAVNFNDIYCSAKLDCCDDPAGAVCAGDGSEDLELLFDATGVRARTIVLGFACTGGTGDDVSTALYMSPLTLDCTDPNAGEDFDADVSLDIAPEQPGNQCQPGTHGVGGAGIATEAHGVDVDAYLFQVAVYRGAEALTSDGAAANKVYWNVALGVTDDIGDCVLRATATADDLTDTADGFDGGVAPGVVYPYVQWDVDLGACGAEQLTFGVPGASVRADYTATGGAGLPFTYAWSPTVDLAVCEPTTVALGVAGTTDVEVPPGCHSAVIKAWGGGGAASDNYDLVSDRYGGAGAYVSMPLEVTPRETLTVVVGGGGDRNLANENHGGGGGGYSGVFRGAVDQAHALLVAGGGGGGTHATDGGVGGAPNGGHGQSFGRSDYEGRGGTTSAGGAHGNTDGSSSSPPTSGSALQGGRGANCTTYAPSVPAHGGGGSGCVGGGGGGGWYGGGGAGHLSATAVGGGGGGSSWKAGAAGTMLAGSRRTPPNTGDPDYASSAGYGGYGWTTGDGKPGRVVIHFDE